MHSLTDLPTSLLKDIEANHEDNSMDEAMNLLSSDSSDTDVLSSVSRDNKSYNQQQQQQHCHRSNDASANQESCPLSDYESDKLKTSVSAKRSVINYLERNLRHRKSIPKPLSIVAGTTPTLDGNNNTDQYQDYNSFPLNGAQESEEDQDAPPYNLRGKDSVSGRTPDHKDVIEQEMATNVALQEGAEIKSISKDEIKIMNFFNSIYNFNQQHSAHLKPPSDLDDNCKWYCWACEKGDLLFNFVYRSVATNS